MTRLVKDLLKILYHKADHGGLTKAELFLKFALEDYIVRIAKEVLEKGGIK